MSVRSPVFDKAGVAMGDTYTDAATFTFGAPVERISMTPYGGDAVVQFLRSDSGEWVPDDGVTFRAGIFRSRPGLRETFGPAGPIGVRVKRALAGVGQSFDLTADLDASSGGVSA